MKEGTTKRTIFVSDGRVTEPFAPRAQETEDPKKPGEETEVETSENVEDLPDLPTNEDGPLEIADVDTEQEVPSEEEDEPSTETEAPSDEGAEEEEEEDLPDPYKLLYQQFAKDGFINDEGEVPEEVDPATLYNKVRNDLTENLTPAIREQVLEEVKNQYGLTQENIQQMLLLKNGYDPSQILGANGYKNLSELPDDTDGNTKETTIRQWYLERGFEDAEISTMIGTAKKNESLDKLFGQAKGYFGNRYKEYKKQEEQYAKQIEQANQQAQARNRQILEKVLTKRQLGETQLTPVEAKALNDAFHNKDQTIEVNGVQYKATKWQIFQYHLQNDLEYLIRLFKEDMFKDELKERVTAEARKEADENFLSVYKKSIQKQQKAIKAKKSKNTDPGGEGKRQVLTIGLNK